MNDTVSLELLMFNLQNYFMFTIWDEGVIKDGLSSHAVYAVTVTKSHEGREMDSWIVYRRYSDFYDFHQRMEARVNVLFYEFVFIIRTNLNFHFFSSRAWENCPFQQSGRSITWTSYSWNEGSSF